MIYIQSHRFVNDCVKIDIILVLAKKTAQEYTKSLSIQYFIQVPSRNVFNPLIRWHFVVIHTYNILVKIILDKL